MKDKILMLVIGFLLGAIITTGCFMLFGNQRRGAMPGEMRDRQNMGNFIPGNGEGSQNRKNANSMQQSTGTSENNV
jgi:hypothetical protein